jgi:hypothetical protein
MVAPDLIKPDYPTILGRFHSHSEAIRGSEFRSFRYVSIRERQRADYVRLASGQSAYTFGGPRECEVPEIVGDDGCGGLRVKSQSYRGFVMIKTMTISVVPFYHGLLTCCLQ